MQFERIVVLTGAGISAESGIRTFRDNNGLWENHRLEDVATPEAFYRDPDLVYRFYNARREQLLSADVTPNAGHTALAALEAKYGDRFLLVTQNVDNLHERAVSQRVLHMHGELLSARCTSSGKSVYTERPFDGADQCQCCQPGASIRPDIVWFGEMPMFMEQIYDALWQADLFIAIGTSGHVYPAAGFVEEAARNGAHTVELNLEPSLVQSAFAEAHYGPGSQVIPKFVESLLK